MSSSSSSTTTTTRWNIKNVLFSFIPFYILVMFLLSDVFSASISSSSSSSRSSSKRLLNPCSGSKVMDGSAGFVDFNSTSVQSLVSFRQLSERASRLKRNVRDLRNLYVEIRFRDNSLAEDLDESGLRIQGIPDIYRPTIESIGKKDFVDIIHSAFENLARVSVFLDQARIGENLAQNERISFAKHFDQLENDHENGLYWLMCALNQIIQQAGQRLKHDVIKNVMNMKVAEVDRNALRHARDYLVLRDFEKLLDVIRIDFASLEEKSI